MTKINIVLLFFVALVFNSQAQQGRNFSMWYMNNVQHNPAAVGTNDNDIRFFSNFRYQYFSVTDRPFQSTSASIEGKIHSKKGYGYLAIGGVFMNDMSGDGRYTVNQAVLPIAYHLAIDEENTITLGLQGGLYQRSVSPGAFTWDNQWNGVGFDQSIAGETFMQASNGFFDVGTGFLYTYRPESTKRFYAGFAAHHLNSPDITVSITDNLYRRFIGQVGGDFKFDQSKFALSPHMLVMFQGPNRNIMLGSNVVYYLHEPSLRTDFFQPHFISFGAYHRLKDAIMLNVQYAFKGFSIGLAYDTNISRLMPASGSIGGFEINLQYDLALGAKHGFRGRY